MLDAVKDCVLAGSSCGSRERHGHCAQGTVGGHRVFDEPADRRGWCDVREGQCLRTEVDRSWCASQRANER
eukprot:2132386-Rhodomonas_salina.1